MTALAPLLLALATATQAPQPEARALAAEWRAQPPATETLLAAWEDADRARRTVLAEAAVRYLDPAVLPLIGAALGDPSVSGLPLRQEALVDAALALGALPGAGVLADFRQTGIRRFEALLERGWLPPAGSAEAVLADDALRRRALQAWAERPGSFPEGLAIPAEWPAYDRMLAGLLQSRRDQDLLRSHASDWVEELLTGGHYAPERAPAIALLRELAPALPDGVLDGTWDALAAPLRAVFLPVLEEAPASVAWDALRSLALEPTLGAEQRATAVRRLFALDGPRAARELLVLVDRAVPTPLLQAVLMGLRTWGDSAACGVLEATVDALPEASRGLALEVLTLRGDAGQRRMWESRYDSLDSRGRRGVLRAAMLIEQDGVLERLWTTVNGPPGERRNDAEAVLREFLKEPALVAGFARGAERIEDVDARVEQWLRVARLRDPAAMPPLRRALADPELAKHPSAFALGGRLLEDEDARPLFRGWWDGSVEVDANARFVAALALYPVEPACEAHVIDHLLDVDEGLLLATVSAIRDDPTVDTLAACRAWAFEPALDEVVRREFAGTLAVAIEKEPHAKHELLAALMRVEGSMRAGIPVDMVALAVCLGAYQFGDEGMRDAVDRALQVGRKAGAGGAPALDQRLDSQRARLARPGYEPSAMAARLLAGLHNPGPAAPPHEEPAIPRIAQEHAAFEWTLRMLGAQETADVRPLVEAGLEDDPGPFHPDLLWLAARRMERPHPGIAERFDDLLARTEPVGSLRRPRGTPSPAAPALEADAERFFERIEEAVMSGDLDAADAWVEAGLVRHPGDRRVHQWRGWVQIARAQLDAAEASFRHADRLGGMTPYLHMEQTLGLAVVDELRDPASDSFERFMAYEEQAGRLLAHRLPVAARPDLARLVPPEELEAVGR